MSQASTWGLQTSGPAKMVDVVGRANPMFDALRSNHEGPTPPAYRVKGTPWADTSVANVITYKAWDSAAWRALFSINTVTGNVLWLGDYALPMVDAPPEMTWISATQISVATGACRDETDSVNIVSASPITVTLSGAPTSAHRHVLLGYDGSGAAVATFSASNALPSGWQAYRRIGSVRTDASGNILSFVQNGDDFAYTTPPLDISTTQGTTSVHYVLSVPLDVKVVARVQGRFSNTVAAQHLVMDPAMADLPPGGAATPLATVGNGAGEQEYGEYRVCTDTSGRIRLCSSASNSTIRLVTLGYQDRRGRDK